MKNLLILSLVSVVAVGCNNSSDPKPADTRMTDSRKVAGSADNTKQNERDRDMATLTPGDQAENDADRAITQKIRQGIVKDNEMSMNAKNIKIITTNGAVTLRGPVKTEKEKSIIGNFAQSIDGVQKLDNQLEIAN